MYQSDNASRRLEQKKHSCHVFQHTNTIVEKKMDHLQFQITNKSRAIQTASHIFGATMDFFLGGGRVKKTHLEDSYYAYGKMIAVKNGVC